MASQFANRDGIVFDYAMANEPACDETLFHRHYMPSGRGAGKPA
jgi:hypothetical protein